MSRSSKVKGLHLQTCVLALNQFSLLAFPYWTGTQTFLIALPMTELEVHVVDQDIIVNLPGTRCTITFQLAPDSPSLIEKPEWTRGDEQAAITLPVFRARAWVAASDRARELGWIV
jgi:hypothetical protein